MTAFLFDENLPRPIARALHELGEPVRHVVDVEELGRGTPDDRLIHFASKWNYRLITRDRRMLKPSQFKALLHAQGVGAYLFRGPKAKTLDPWDLVQAIFRVWPEIRRHASEREPPYVLWFSLRGTLKPYR